MISAQNQRRAHHAAGDKWHPSDFRTHILRANIRAACGASANGSYERAGFHFQCRAPIVLINTFENWREICLVAATRRDTHK